MTPDLQCHMNRYIHKMMKMIPLHRSENGYFWQLKLNNDDKNCISTEKWELDLAI